MKKLLAIPLIAAILLASCEDGGTFTTTLPAKTDESSATSPGIGVTSPPDTEGSVTSDTVKPATEPEIELPGSEGLNYELTESGDAYAVVGSWYCTDTDIVIPSTYEGLPVVKIADHAFCYMVIDDYGDAYYGPQSVTIPNSVTEIGAGAFSSCRNLMSITIPSCVTKIGDGAFSFCTRITDITIPSGVTDIGEVIFVGCENLNSITVASENPRYHSDGNCLIETASGELLSGCNGSVIPTDGSVKKINEWAFCGYNGLTNLTIPEGVTVIEGISSCQNLMSVRLPDSLKVIGDEAFFGCTSLTDITLPDGLTQLGRDVFRYCKSLTDITIPGNVVKIGERAFFGCDNLASVTISAGVTEIGYNAFGFCKSLHDITVAAENPIYHSNHNCVIETASKTLVIGGIDSVIPTDGSVTAIGECAFYGSGITSLIIPDGVTQIGESAFCECSTLLEITIPESVTQIGKSAFYRCSSLTGITIPESVTIINEDTFCYCSSFTSIIIPKSVTEIGREAFFNCTGLKSVSIPAGITEIASCTFWYCGNISDVYYAGTKEQWESIEIKGGNEFQSATIHYNSIG